MLVADDFKHYFLASDKSRGKQYFRESRVTITHANSRAARATVRGNRDYNVEPEFDSDEMYGSCTCPRYMDGEHCKHIWATLLQLEHDGDQAFEKTQARKKSSKRKWERQFLQLEQELVRSDDREDAEHWFSDGRATQCWYVIDLSEHVGLSTLEIDIYQNTTRKDGTWGKAKHRSLDSVSLDEVSDPAERQILYTLKKLDGNSGYYGYGSSKGEIAPIHYDLLLPLISQTGRFVWTLKSDRSLQDPNPIHWDGETVWQLHCNIEQAKSTLYHIKSELVSNNVAIPVDDVVFALNDGLVLFADRMCRLDPGQATWINWLRDQGTEFAVPQAHIEMFLQRLASTAQPPKISVNGQELGTSEPRGRLRVRRHGWQPSYLEVWVDMQYGSASVPVDSDQQLVWDENSSQLIQRNESGETKLIDQLRSFPFQNVDAAAGIRPDEEEAQLRLHKKWLRQIVTHFTELGWSVVAEGKQMRRATSFDIKVSTNTDWFDLSANIEFGENVVSLPALITALRKKSNFVVLDDGSQGILPEEWLEQYQRLAEFGQFEGDELRFPKSQTMLLDAMLAEKENVTLDQDFSALSQRLRELGGIEAGKETKEFQGELRAYQRDGLGWFEFLRDFHFGGCLADDMGLGKTVQVLALLEARRTRKLQQDEERRQSLVVVPKSLVFNWMDEASRFSPKLKVLNYTGLHRSQLFDEIKGSDLVITTYGTLRRDITKLKDIRFDYAILDESQAIKNSSAQVTKASRLIQSDHRLAMTGTPIENHLGELWSLFEYLNPGMLGRQRSIKQLVSDDSAEVVQLLRRALQPFILRRTKDQVLTELPPKTEQTLMCEMNTTQSKLYKELRDYYRVQLGKKVKEIGVRRSKIHVLEALLRLRQAACDPRLLDKEGGEQGAKLDLLETEIESVIQEGHKVLIFSQFTSLLALVKDSFDKKQWNYQYLDGRTRNRGERVKAFQEDPDCKIFLISLKAGGHGLNLTAADYVFILDPWWNPAVEAQAVDRSHRIGQTRPVFAYRLICKDTVEEKIVQLQQSKRELADGIIAANESLISELSESDLEFLFQ